MKWYFASRVRHMPYLVQIAEFLVARGQEIGSTWIYGKSLKPYHENVAEVQTVGTENAQAILESDIFILISDPEGTDMFVELGIAIGSGMMQNQKPRIYIVGNHGKRSLMQLHPFITHCHTLEEVLNREGITYEKSELPVLES